MAALDGMLDGLAPQRDPRGRRRRGRGHGTRPGAVPRPRRSSESTCPTTRSQGSGGQRISPAMFGDATSAAVPRRDVRPRARHRGARARSRIATRRSPSSRGCARHADRLGAVRADLAGRQHRAGTLRARPRQHARARQPLDPLGIHPLRQHPLPSSSGRQPTPVDDGPGASEGLTRPRWASNPPMLITPHRALPSRRG